MTRITYYDDGDVDSILAYGRWERNSQATVRSKRGQASLRELEAALLALPEPRLYADTFCTTLDDGTVQACVLGALALHRGLDVPDYFDDELNADDQARWAANHLGLTYTLAWNLIERNDEMYAKATPDERFTMMLGWIRDQLSEHPTQRARW